MKSRLSLALEATYGPWYEIKYQLYKKLFYSWYTPLDNFVHFIVKVCQYIPILWIDRDWDYCFILILLQYKLSRVRKCIVKNDLIEGAKELGDNIAHAEMLIERILKDEYVKDDWAKIHKKFGWADLFSKDKIKRTEKQQKAYSKAIRALIEKEVKLRSKDYDELFKHLRNNIESYWD